MTNNIKIRGGQGSITIEIGSLNEDYGLSRSGKTLLVASTYGGVDLSEYGFPETRISLNIYRRKPDARPLPPSTHDVER